MLVGPLPPPPGGMANQTRQLEKLLREEGLDVSVVRTNAPYRPEWVGRIRMLRALFRIVPYLFALARGCGRADVVHVMANSGWAWHLLAVPAIWVARLRGKPVVVNYRGGLAREFLESQGAIVRVTLSQAAALVVPTEFLKQVFGGYGLPARVIPNVVDVQRFRPADERPSRPGAGPHIVVTRNLEHLYGNDVAIRALAQLWHRFPSARLTIAGSGPEAQPLGRLAVELGVAEAVRFAGRLSPDQMADLYRSADVTLNPSRADNTPNSILESLACGVPVVSTDVGGVPFLVEHGRTAWLVRADEPEAMAGAVAHVLDHPELRQRMIANGLALARSCSWPVVRSQWLDLYRAVQAGVFAASGTSPSTR
jgi:glycosyltransferase involved in cell wall biosynthesis